MNKLVVYSLLDFSEGKHLFFLVFFFKFLNDSGVISGGSEMNSEWFLKKLMKNHVFLVFLGRDIVLQQKPNINIMRCESSQR